MSITPELKAQLMKEYATKDGDTGSPEVQVAILSSRIATLTEHFKQQIDQLRRIGQLDGDGLKVPALAAPALDDLEDTFAEPQVDAAWRRQVARLREIEDIKPHLWYNLY